MWQFRICLFLVVVASCFFAVVFGTLNKSEAAMCCGCAAAPAVATAAAEPATPLTTIPATQ